MAHVKLDIRGALSSEHLVCSLHSWKRVVIENNTYVSIFQPLKALCLWNRHGH
jgi:hypothetical protein